jgi:phytol kinase
VSAGDWLGIFTLLVVVSALLGGLRLYQVIAKPEPELVRKLFHASGGLFGLPLPWIFNDLKPVLILAFIVANAFVAMRFIGRLRGGVGQVLFAVKRESIGELCYIASMVLLFWFSRGDKLLYTVPLLMLALADTAAALVGEEYGKLQIRAAGGPKSIEGAIAFFFTAFFCVHVPVLLWGNTGRAESLLIAVNLSIMVMLAEAAAWWGLDNLIVPLWGYLLLKSQIDMDTAALTSDLVFVLCLGMIMWLWRNRTTLADDTLFGAALWGYVVWSVGGWSWSFPPLLQLLTYATVTTQTPQNQLRMFRFPVVLAQIAGSVFWLLFYRESGESWAFYPFASCYAANVAIIALVRHKCAVPDLRWAHALSTSVAKGMIVAVPSILIMDGLTMRALLDASLSLMAVLVATALFYRLQPGLSTFPVDGPRWIRQALIVAGATPLVLLGHIAMFYKVYAMLIP